jgi:putative endonuclease
MKERGYYVYILASGPRGTLYVGVTSDLIKRVYAHRTGVVEGFTAKHNLHRLVYFEGHQALAARLEDRAD